MSIPPENYYSTCNVCCNRTSQIVRQTSSNVSLYKAYGADSVWACHMRKFLLFFNRLFGKSRLFFWWGRLAASPLVGSNKSIYDETRFLFF